MALCFGGGIVEVLERIGHIMDFMKPDLTTVHKEEPLLAIRLCSQHVRALLGWTAQYTCGERTCLGGRWNHWRLNKCIWPAPGWVGVLARHGVSSEYIHLLKHPPLIKELCQLENRPIRSDRESVSSKTPMDYNPYVSQY